MYYDLMKNILHEMDIDQSDYMKMIDIKYWRKLMYIVLANKDKAQALEYYIRLKNVDALTLADRVYMRIGKNIFSVFVMRSLSKAKRMLIS